MVSYIDLVQALKCIVEVKAKEKDGNKQRTMKLCVVNVGSVGARKIILAWPFLFKGGGKRGSVK